MSEGESRDEFHDVAKSSQKEHHAEEERQVVVARQHMSRAELDVFQVAALQDALPVRIGDAVCKRRSK